MVSAGVEEEAAAVEDGLHGEDCEEVGEHRGEEEGGAEDEIVG